MRYNHFKFYLLKVNYHRAILQSYLPLWEDTKTAWNTCYRKEWILILQIRFVCRHLRLLVSQVFSNERMERPSFTVLQPMVTCLLCNCCLLVASTRISQLLRLGCSRIVTLLKVRQHTQGSTAFSLACGGGHIELVNYFLSIGCEVNPANKVQMWWKPNLAVNDPLYLQELARALHSACKGGHREVAEIVVRAGADKEALSNKVSIFLCYVGLFTWLKL